MRHFWSFFHGQGKVELLSWAAEVWPDLQLGPPQQPQVVAFADPSFGPGARPACPCQATAALNASRKESSSPGVSAPLSPLGCLASSLVLLTGSPSAPSSFFHPTAHKGPWTRVGIFLLEIHVGTFLGVFLSPFLSPETLIHAHVFSLLFSLKICSLLAGRNVRFPPWQVGNIFSVLCATSRDHKIWTVVLHN